MYYNTKMSIRENPIIGDYITFSCIIFDENTTKLLEITQMEYLFLFMVI